jgi:multiple sugar transport system substrate-binding protein
MARDKIDTSRFLPGALEPAYDGKLYGFRHDTAFWLLYYNKDLFDKAGVAYPPATGWTLDEFMETACSLSKPDENQWGMHNLHWITGILIQQQGLPYLEMVDDKPQYRIDDPRTIAMYQKFGDFINQRNCQPTADQSSSLGGADPFIAGRAAMQFNGNWGFGYMKENATFNWGVASIPGTSQPNVGMKIGITKSSPNQEAAWTFLKWLTYEPEATRFRAERGMGQPALLDAEANKIFLSGPTAPDGLDAAVKALADPANSFQLLIVPGLNEANNLINPATDEIMNGLSAAADVLPPVVPKANEILVKEWNKATGQ